MPLWVLALRVTGLGWYVAFCIIAGVVGGLWLDGVFNTRPAITVVGVVLGAVAAFYGVYRSASEFLKQQVHREGDQGES